MLLVVALLEPPLKMSPKVLVTGGTATHVLRKSVYSLAVVFMLLVVVSDDH